MKKILLFISILATLAFTNVFVESASILIAPSSKIVIHGNTNVNNFKCQYSITDLNKPIAVHFQKNKDKFFFDKTVLTLESTCFDCGGTGINKDFQDLVESNTFPQIFINLKEVSKDPNNKKIVNALLDLNIAGISKSYTIPVKLEDKDLLLIQGDLNLNIRDFNLEPPKKALGLIVVKDTIKISLHLEVQEYSKLD